MKTTRYFLAVLALGTLISNANAQVLSAPQKSDALTEKAAKAYNPEMSVIRKGDNIVNVTLGVTNFKYMPPFLAASYERTFWQLNDNLCFGAGATVGFTGYSGAYGLGLYALCNLHFTAVPKLDLFTGLDLGTTIGIDSSANQYYDAGKAYGNIFHGLVYPVHIGASYYFTDTLAATLRAGGWGLLSLGIAAKF